MTTSPYVPYIVTELFCIVFAFSVWVRLNKSIGTEHEIRELRNMILSYLIMLVSDIFWTLFNSGILTPNPWIIRSVDAVLIMSISAGCYFWFMFIQDRLHTSRSLPKRQILLLTLPFLFICALDITSIFTGFLFYLDDNNCYQSTRAFFLQTGVNYFYITIPTVTCAYRAIRTRSRAERGEYATYASYMIAPMIGGMLEGVFPLVPVLSLSMFMIIQILFLMIQNMQIYNDALTNLNNRRRLNQFLEDCLPRASPERPVVLLMMDINCFKSINDTYGHIEGDNALRAFAGVLRTAAAPHKAFIARYGGDEFCLVTDTPDQRPDKMAEEIQRLLLAAQEQVQVPQRQYLLTVSIGTAVCSSPGYSPEEFLCRADLALYERKKAWHQAPSA